MPQTESKLHPELIDSTLSSLISHEYEVPVMFLEEYLDGQGTFEELKRALIEIYSQGLEPLQATVYEAIIEAVAAFVEKLESKPGEERARVQNGISEGKTFLELTGYEVSEPVETERLGDYHAEGISLHHLLSKMYEALNVKEMWKIPSVLQQTSDLKKRRPNL